MYCNRWIVPGTFLAGLALATAACAPEQSHRDRKRETDRTVLLLSQVERERDALRAEVDALKARPQPTTDQAALAKEAADLRNEVRRLEGELKRSQEQTLNVTEVNTTLKNDLNPRAYQHHRTRAERPARRQQGAAGPARRRPARHRAVTRSDQQVAGHRRTTCLLAPLAS
jgi:chromosome segregation ATPase